MPLFLDELRISELTAIEHPDTGKPTHFRQTVQSP